MEVVESPAARKEEVSLNSSFVILDMLRREEDVDGAHRSDTDSSAYGTPSLRVRLWTLSRLSCLQGDFVQTPAFSLEHDL